MMSVIIIPLIAALVARTVTSRGCSITRLPDGCVKADCTGINVKDVPRTVPNETCILLLRDNIMEVIANRSFQRFVNLTSLDLSRNKLQNITEHAFNGLINLKRLNLSSNRLDFDQEKIHLTAFSPLVNVKELELQGNLYVGYPDQHLSFLAALESLSIDGLENTTFGPGFSNLTGLTYLDTSGKPGQRKCNLTSLYKGTFENVKSLTDLNVSHCSINAVESDTFLPLGNIQSLDVSYNENLLFTGLTNVLNGLQNSNIRRLYLNKIVPSYAVCVIIKREFVENLQNTSLEYVEADDNRIEILAVEALNSLPKSLTEISAKNNRFTEGDYMKHLFTLGNLTSLDLSGKRVAKKFLQYFSKTPDAYDRSHDGCKTVASEVALNRYSLFVDRYMTRDRISNVTLIKIPPKLKNLTYSFSQLAFQLADIHLDENSLDHVDLSYNVLTVWPGPVTGVKNITYLNLSNNFAHYVNETFFENFKALKHLNISYNHLSRSIFSDVNGTLFRNLSKLEILDLSSNDILLLPHSFIEGLSDLRELNISENIINSLELNYTTNSKLKFINASDNLISYIPSLLRDTLDQLALRNNLSLDLAWNPFECSCDRDQLDFLNWLYTTKVKLLNFNRYMCVVYDNKHRNLRSVRHIYKQLQQDCKLYIALTMGLLSFVVLVTTTIVCGIIYRFRWRLIYLYYVGKRKLKVRATHEESFEFDAFVSFADEDLEFVTPLMLSRLDNDQGLKLYIRHRDAVPGGTIAENIIDGIQRSKKCVLLLSEASLAKKWCRYELQMSNVEEISTKRCVLIIVLLGSVAIELIPGEILYHLQKKPPHQYPGRDSGQTEMFWESLAEEIRS